MNLFTMKAKCLLSLGFLYDIRKSFDSTMGMLHGRAEVQLSDTVSFHNFKSQNFKS